ncbi:MAG: hypothetical protein IKE63_01420 [Bacilli bacterium]|nr:hypothetical protein [Bacilli bacterium]
MDGRLVYNSLEEAVEALVDESKRLDDPIDNYMQQQNQIGDDGSAAWGGTAATRIVPVLAAIKADIVELQEACSDFSSKVKIAATVYAGADVVAQTAVETVKDVVDGTK